MKTLTNLLLTWMFLFLTACSFMSPVKVGPDSGYVINSVPHPAVHGGGHVNALLVMTPDTNPVFNSTRIAFTVKPYQITYYSGSRWIQTPAEMLTPLLTQTLQQTSHFTNVITPPFSAHYDYALRTNIKTLLIDYTRRPAVLEMTLQEQLLSMQSGHIVASRTFSTSVPLPVRSPYGAAIAANRATERLLAEIASWCAHHAR